MPENSFEKYGKGRNCDADHGKRNQNLGITAMPEGQGLKNLELHLYADDMEVMDATPFGPERGNVWSYSYTGLKKFTEDGKPITYRVEETVPENYSADEEGLKIRLKIK